MLLQGNLKECPLSDLLDLLASRRETGRLDLNLGNATAQLYLMGGKPVDCCMGSLTGGEALTTILSHTEGQFRFSSGGVPPNLMFRRMPEPFAVMPNGTAAASSVINLASEPQSPKPLASPSVLKPNVQTAQSSASDSKGYFRSLSVVIVLAALAGGVGWTIGSVIASIQHRTKATVSQLKSAAARVATNQVKQATPQHSPTPLPNVVNKEQPQSNAKSEDHEALTVKKKSAKVLSIPVVVRIEDGRVVEAYAAQPHPGQEAYEATAVRLARQKRFDSKSGTETLVLAVTEK